jgi:hypothetical protein
VSTVDALDPISFEELDERAALRERVDTKYVISHERLAVAVRRFGDRYLVLETDGRARSTTRASTARPRPASWRFRPAGLRPE